MYYAHQNENTNNIDVTAYVRLLQASPDAPPLDVYVNDIKLLPNLKFKDFTEYHSAEPGYYNLKVYPTTEDSMPIIDRDISMDDSMIYTIAIKNLANDMDFQVIPDMREDLPKDKAYIRFIHLSPNLSPVDVLIDNKETIMDMGYEDVTEYIVLTPGTHSLKINQTGTNETVVSSPKTTLKAGKLYAGYIVGLDGDRPGLQILFPLEGASYL